MLFAPGNVLIQFVKRGVFVVLGWHTLLCQFLLLLAVAGTLTVVERNELDGDDAITIAAMV